MGGATVAIVTPLYGGGFLLGSAAIGDGAGQDPALFGDGLTVSCPSLQSLPTGRIALQIINKRPTGLNGHLSIRDFTLTSCQKGSYLYINSPIIE